MIIKNIYATVLVLCVTTVTSAQILNPTHWEISVKKLDGKTYEIHAKAKMDEGWHIYAKDTPEGGPMPTEMNIDVEEGIILLGTLKEFGNRQSEYVDVFGVDTFYYGDEVDFVQAISLKDHTITHVKGYVSFMACKEQQCLAPTEVEFYLPLK